MAKPKFTVLTAEGEIHWPRECASCCATAQLQPVHVGIAKEVTGLVDVAVGRRRYQAAGLHYLACARHAGWAAFASWLTRKSPLPNLLRGAAYVIGVPALALFAIKGLVWLITLATWIVGRRRTNPWSAMVPADWFFTGMFLACAALFVLVVMSFRRVPVRLLKLQDDSMVIRFANERFARHFAKANPDLVVSRD